MPVTALLVQVRLENGPTRLTTWLPADSGIRVGNRVTLKGDDVDDRRWDIVAVSAPHSADEINRGWHNNI